MTTTINNNMTVNEIITLFIFSLGLIFYTVVFVLYISNKQTEQRFFAQVEEYFKPGSKPHLSTVRLR